MKCCRCGDSVESGKSFIPIEAAGAPNRKWVCTACASLVQKQLAKNVLGEEGLRITSKINPDFLR